MSACYNKRNLWKGSDEMKWDVDEHITLVPLYDDYADAMFTVVDQNRAYFRQWLPWVDNTETVFDTRQFIAFTEKQFAMSGVINMAILYDGQFAGTVGTHEINRQDRSTSIGYWLAPDFTGKGVMTKSVAYLLDYLFDKVKLHRIEIRAAGDNQASRAIPERLGFTLEGTAREAEWLYDHYVSHAVYSLLEGDRT